ncbi:hypothetical protein C8Q74DRAFT_131759 [Fomes fomentarius]|nr:hypothetical protein C8Q74DRAFT_131759 [Fomes fomentarius]
MKMTHVERNNGELETKNTGARPRAPHLRLPDAGRDILIDYYDNVTKFPKKIAREELAAKIRREVPRCELYTEERVNRFFAHRRATAKGVKQRDSEALGEHEHAMFNMESRPAGSVGIKHSLTDPHLGTLKLPHLRPFEPAPENQSYPSPVPIDETQTGATHIDAPRLAAMLHSALSVTSSDRTHAGSAALPKTYTELIRWLGRHDPGFTVETLLYVG